MVKIASFSIDKIILIKQNQKRQKPNFTKKNKNKNKNYKIIGIP
jgi:hypothetical protein